MANKILPSIAPKPTVFPPTTGCDNCENYLYQLEELEEEVEQVQLDLDSLTDEVDSIPRITVDSQISDSSTNPVQNRVISEALEDKQDVLIEGDGIDVASDSTISLKPATTSTLGGVKVGNGLVVASDGTLSSTGGSGGGGVADVQMNGTSIVTNDVAKVTDDNGNMQISGDFTIGTGKYILADNFNLLGRNTSGNVLLGYGPYASNVGETRIFGDYLRLYSHNGIFTNSNIYVSNHSEPIGAGSSDTTPGMNVTTNSWFEGSLVTFTAGVYIIFISADFEANSTGQRRIRAEVWSPVTRTYTGIARSDVSQNAVGNGWNTHMQSSFRLSVDSNTQICISVWQNSGSTLSTEGILDYIRIR